MSRQTSSGLSTRRHLPSRRGVSGHLPSECSACLTDAECQGRCRPDEECQGICLLNAARVLQTQNVKADVVRTGSVRAFAFWMQRVSPDAECQGKCLPDDTHHGICLPDEDCQGICLLNTARVFRTQNVKANVDRTIRAMASAFRMRSVRAYAFCTQRVSYRRRVSRQMSSGRVVSGHLPSERSICLTDAEYQGRWHLDEECQGICLLNAARVLQTQNVKADVVRTRSVRAFAFWTQRV